MGNIIHKIASPGEPGEYEREQARIHVEQRGEAFEKSKQCYQEGDHEGAKKWSEQGKYHDRMVKEYNEKASKVIFDSKNEGRSLDEVDLHGLFVEEAKKCVEKHIKLCQRQGKKEFTIIVGKGIHSANHIAKLKPAIMELVEAHQLRCTVDPRNEGCLLVELVDDKSRVGLFGFLKNECCVM